MLLPMRTCVRRKALLLMGRAHLLGELPAPALQRCTAHPAAGRPGFYRGDATLSEWAAGSRPYPPGAEGAEGDHAQPSRSAARLGSDPAPRAARSETPWCAASSPSTGASRERADEIEKASYVRPFRLFVGYGSRMMSSSSEPEHAGRETHHATDRPAEAEQHAGRRPRVRRLGPSPPQAARRRDPTRRAHIPSRPAPRRASGAGHPAPAPSHVPVGPSLTPSSLAARLLPPGDGRYVLRATDGLGCPVGYSDCRPGGASAR